MGRDLAAAHWSWDDVGAGLPFGQFVHFVLYAPAGSAVHHAMYSGWDPLTHLVANLVDIGNIWLWRQTRDGQAKRPKNQPNPIARPQVGRQDPAETEVEQAQATAVEYLRLVAEADKRMKGVA